jgi:hypothetical protein
MGTALLERSCPLLLQRHPLTAEYKAAFDRLVEASTRREIVRDVDTDLLEDADREFQEAWRSFLSGCAAANASFQPP